MGAADAEVQSTFETHSAGGEITGVPTLIGLLDKKVVDTALRWLKIDRAQRCDYHWNDTGNADRLADLYGHELLYCIERKSYYVWTGQRWQFDEFVEVEKRAEKTTLEAFGEAKHITDGEKRKAFLRFVNSSLSRSALANMMHLAKKKVRQVSASDFDPDPWALNTENGTVDLAIGGVATAQAGRSLEQADSAPLRPTCRVPAIRGFLISDHGQPRRRLRSREYQCRTKRFLSPKDLWLRGYWEARETSVCSVR